METTGAKRRRPVLNWVLSQGPQVLAFQVKRDGRRYEVSVTSPGLRKRLYAKCCQGGVHALQLHAALVRACDCSEFTYSNLDEALCCFDDLCG